MAKRKALSYEGPIDPRSSKRYLTRSLIRHAHPKDKVGYLSLPTEIHIRIFDHLLHDLEEAQGYSKDLIDVRWLSEHSMFNGDLVDYLHAGAAREERFIASFLEYGVDQRLRRCIITAYFDHWSASLCLTGWTEKHDLGKDHGAGVQLFEVSKPDAYARTEADSLEIGLALPELLISPKSFETALIKPAKMIAESLAGRPKAWDLNVIVMVRPTVKAGEEEPHVQSLEETTERVLQARLSGVQAAKGLGLEVTASVAVVPWT